MFALTLLLASSLSPDCPGGRIEETTNPYNADFRVREVSSSPDLRVKVVYGPPYRCGMWHFVEQNPDYLVYFANAGSVDFTIMWVASFPGRR